MSIQTLFKSNQLSSKYIFRDGSVANFIRGMFYTDDPTQIAELENEVKTKHPHIYVDATQKTIDTEKLDPLWRVKQELREEIRLEMMAAADPSRAMGDYEQGKLNAASTTDIAPVAAGAGPGVSPAMVALMAKNKLAAQNTPVVETPKAE